ncbi:MAG: hypothetical protein II008_15925 [Oscillospiraceae bacterium]|nr:hypothetical protein [Oscillospiraceae bacterium]
MTAKTFKAFSQIVENAEVNDPIWWEGYFWLELTTRQAEKIGMTLREKAFIGDVTDIKGRKAHLLPSGLTLAYTA